MRDRPRSISIFLPAHNEVLNLEETVRDVLGASAETFQDYELLLVDDGSVDGTGALAEKLAAEHQRIRIIHNPRRQGIAASYQVALQQARKAYFAFLPADGEVDPASIRAIFQAVGSADLVLPYHQNPQARQRHRRILTWLSTVLLNTLFRYSLRYYQGPAVYPTALARAMPRTTQGFLFLTEMVVHALAQGASYVEVGLIHRERQYGRSKAMGLANILTALRTIVSLWWRVRVRKSAPRAATWSLSTSDVPGPIGAGPRSKR